ncbi:MAG: stage II sporulation protein P [Oscillospiraceae bacterium]|nr:stage II sporulation protein P [Oscillospiraceae bacterium]
MKKEKQALRIGSLSILLAVLVRFICSVGLGDRFELFSVPRLASFLIYTETGRVVEPTTATTTAPSPSSTAIQAPEPDMPERPVLSIPEQKPVFTAEDMQYLTMQIDCRRDPDLEALLTQPLEWDLRGSEPTILIIHTHGTEAYTPTADTQYEQYNAEFRTTDQRYNMISIGDELTRLLEEAGLTVIHDRTAYDEDDYVDSYDASRAAVKEHLRQHPTIKMVIDVHRDAAEYSSGAQWAAKGEVDGQSAAQIMMVVGTDAMSLSHPNWQTNLSIAEKLTVQMERSYPGMSRNVNLRAARFNQDLAMGALIAEVGAAGNTHAEAIRGVAVLADAIVALATGTE